MTTLTPLEQARQAYAAAQQRVQRLGQTLHQLSIDRAAALAAGDVDEANRIGSLSHETNISYRAQPVRVSRR